VGRANVKRLDGPFALANGKLGAGLPRALVYETAGGGEASALRIVRAERGVFCTRFAQIASKSPVLRLDMSEFSSSRAHLWPGVPLALASAILFGASAPFAKLLLGSVIRSCSQGCSIWAQEPASSSCTSRAGS
jgi:hypothetical protein